MWSGEEVGVGWGRGDGDGVCWVGCDYLIVSSLALFGLMNAAGNE